MTVTIPDCTWPDCDEPANWRHSNSSETWVYCDKHRCVHGCERFG